MIYYFSRQFTLYIPSKRFWLRGKGLSDGGMVSMTKDEYGSAVKLMYSLKNSLKSIKDE